MRALAYTQSLRGPAFIALGFVLKFLNAAWALIQYVTEPAVVPG